MLLLSRFIFVKFTNLSNILAKLNTPLAPILFFAKCNMDTIVVYLINSIIPSSPILLLNKLTFVNLVNDGANILIESILRLLPFNIIDVILLLLDSTSANIIAPSMVIILLIILTVVKFPTLIL